MRLRHRRAQAKASQHTHRWLVSYADYMTIMFALFVVLYAIAINHKDEQFAVFSQSLEQIFTKATNAPASDGTGAAAEGLLTQPLPANEALLYGQSLQAERQASQHLLPEHGDVTQLPKQQLGEPLERLVDELTNTLLEEIRQGDAQLQLDNDWLTIEMNSAMVFASASATVTHQAEAVIARIAKVLALQRNYLRIRGYTDDLAINNELFSSNWQLSAARAAAVVKQLQQEQIIPERMALEGYGQYSPFADNNSAQGRAQNRKVVIAISKYALPTPKIAPTDTPNGLPDGLPNGLPSVEPSEKPQPQEVHRPGQDKTIKIIRLPHGGIRITTRNEDNGQ
ncbi:OmpA family protein [Pseudoalteromonas sp. T1lg48]|uniref:OmpA family protein n=1 Tax=Pseudoalteromonas sp. T1lg48 TaxID=2077100 RepID=UPI000CF6F217|nr:OmpA family protein [Pseudoalteromonas sp. T1lg48]